MSGFGQSSSFGGGFGGGGASQFPSTPSNNTGGGFSTSSTPLAFGQQQQQQQTPLAGQPFGSSVATTTAFGSGGGFGTPAPSSSNPAVGTAAGFGTTAPAASSATPFGSSATTTTTGAFGNSSSSSGFGGGGFGSAVAPSATTTTNTSTSSFGFGQQQQQQQSSGFGTSSTTNNTSNVFGSSSTGGTATTTTAAPTAPLAFGSSSTVVAKQPSTTPAAPSSSSFFGASSSSGPAAATTTPSTVFGNAASSSSTTASTTAPAFGGAIGSSNSNTATTATAATPFGSSSTAFGGASSTNTTGGFGSSAAGTTAVAGGFGSSTGATVAGGFGSSSSSTANTTPASGGTNLSTNASAFAPSASSSNTNKGGFGSSSAGGVFGGGGFGASARGDKTINSNTSSGFGGGFGGQATASTTTTSTSSAFGGGGFGTSTTTSAPSTSPFGKSADGNNAGRTNESSSSFPFGSRIPRKEKVSQQTAGGGGGGDASKLSLSEGDAQLAALRAKIQEKKQRLLDKKKNQKQQQQHQSNSPARGMSPPRTTADGDRNAELAAKNALRFASQQENKALSSLLPSDLQGRTQASQSNDDRTTPLGGDAGNTNNANDDDDLDHRNVNNAKSLIGICTSMCPDEELIRREKEGDIQLLEITDPGGLHPANWTLRDTAVKRFRRSAADFKLDIPELVRPPEVLERVCGYLEEWVMERDRQGPDKRWAQAATTTTDTPPPLDVYQFIWDRTRMIRKDFILQNYIGTGGKCDARAVRCHERIARWHAMCEHQLSHIPDFVKHQSQQNIAELGQTMKTLNLYYDDALGRALTETASSGGRDSQGCVSDIVMGKSPIDFDGSALSNDAQSADVMQRIIGKNGATSPSRGTAEPEMRGLYILLTMNNEGGMEVLKYSGRLCTQKPDIFYSKPVQLALTIFRAKKDHNYAKFFRLLRCPSTPYLYSCIMFKYVEHMRKETLIMMSKVYGAKHKTTGEAFYDSYPLEKLVNLLCYEDESEAKEACRHYGITVEGDQVRWRHSKFREPRDPEKGLIIPLKPRKMIRTIESKLNGATRLSVCRGGVSGQGATLAGAPTNVDAEALLKERQRAQEEMKQKLAEAKAKEEADRMRQEKIKKENTRQERLAAEKRAKEEAARRAEQERMRKEQLKRDRLEKERQEQERIAAEKKARKEAAERAERLRLEKEAKEKKEREIAEARRLAEEERKRKLAEEERIRRLEEERRRQEEEKKRRIAREAERRRKAEEERIRKAKEEEERKIEMAWRQKVENARKLLICRLLQKQMRRHDSSQKSRNSLSKLDPTCTQYPTSRVELCQDLFCGTSSNTEVIVRRAGSCDELENQLYRLATSPRQPMDLSEVVTNRMRSFVSCQANESYPLVVRGSHVKLFKLAILLPKRTPQHAQLYDTLRMWVESHLILDEVSSSVFSSCAHQIDARAVIVIGNEGESHWKNCDAALVLLPSFADESASITYSEKAQELLDQNVPRMVLVLDTEDASQRNAPSTERLLDTLLGESPGGAGLQREGVAAPNLSDFDIAFQKCCQVLLESYVSTATAQIDNEDNITSLDPSLVRVPLSDLGFLCLQQLIRNLDENSFFNNASSNSHDALFDLCRNALSTLSHQLSCAYQELHQRWQNWPAHEFFVSERVESFFGEDCDLPANWYELKSDLGSELKQFFQHLLERSTLTLFVESIIGSLSGSLRHDLLTMMDNGEISSCFSTIVTMVVSGEINLVSDGQTILYLPVTKLRSVVEHAAAYEVPESVDRDVDIPYYLLHGFPSASDDDSLEEKENYSALVKNDNFSTGEKRTRTSVESEDNTITKRSRPPEDIADTNLRLLQDRDEGTKKRKLKRTKLNDGRKVESVEERSSKSFTSYLEALLGGGDVQL